MKNKKTFMKFYQIIFIFVLQCHEIGKNTKTLIEIGEPDFINYPCLILRKSK